MYWRLATSSASGSLVVSKKFSVVLSIRFILISIIMVHVRHFLCERKVGKNKLEIRFYFCNHDCTKCEDPLVLLMYFRNLIIISKTVMTVVMVEW